MAARSPALRWTVVLALYAAGCDGSDGEMRDAAGPAADLMPLPPDFTLPNDPTYQNLRQRVFASCRGEACHTLDPVMNLDDLSTLVNVPAAQSPKKLRVKPKDPDNSFLYQKISLTFGAGEGDPMPPQGTLLPAEDIKVIRDWIAAGALDN